MPQPLLGAMLLLHVKGCSLTVKYSMLQIVGGESTIVGATLLVEDYSSTVTHYMFQTVDASNITGLCCRLFFHCHMWYVSFGR